MSSCAAARSRSHEALPMSTNDPITLAANLPFLDDLYDRYRADPDSVDPSFLPLFGLLRGGNGSAQKARAEGAPALAEPLLRPAPGVGPAAVSELPLDKVYALVNSYRSRGHLEANLDPLGMLPRVFHPELDP